MKNKEYGSIYLIRNNIDNKIYIGQTTRNFDRRYGRNLEKFTHNEHLKNAINKYGINNFYIDKCFDVCYSKEELDKLEDMYIKFYDTVNSECGYNKMYGGSVGKHTQEIRDKISEIQTDINGVEVICITLNKRFKSISKAAKTYNTSSGEIIRCCRFEITKAGYLNDVPLQWMYYRDYIDGKKHLDVKNHKIICITTNEIFEKASDAILKYKNTTLSGISQCCSKIYASCGELEDGTRLQWLKYDDYLKGDKPKEIKDNRVVCVTTGEVFATGTEASNKYKIDLSHILDNCNFKSNYSGVVDGVKLQWLFYKDFIEGKEHVILKDDRVICLNTEQIFNNVKEASVFYGIDKSALAKCCRGLRKTCGKDKNGSQLRWMKYDEYIKNIDKDAV